MKDEYYYEIKAYRDRYRQCTPDQILAELGKMYDFLFGRMTAKDYEKYMKIQAALDRPADPQPEIKPS